jgi:hypothetical protein
LKHLPAEKQREFQMEAENLLWVVTFRFSNQFEGEEGTQILCNALGIAATVEKIT